MQREEHTSGLSKLRQKWRSFMEFKTHVLYLWRKEIRSERSYLFNGEKNVYFLNNRQSNQAIYSQLVSGRPVMIARHGGYEVQVAANFDTGK